MFRSLNEGRVAPEYYNELRDANNVKIDFLPNLVLRFE